ncbi:hypothetical protein CVCC1112_3435 [Paenarthrobacter nicotinovorans]|nr:hypothetical protein CVCC1112_3435 [Paenarthrobacter nicotinovorans]
MVSRAGLVCFLPYRAPDVPGFQPAHAPPARDGKSHAPSENHVQDPVVHRAPTLSSWAPPTLPRPQSCPLLALRTGNPWLIR